MQLSIDRRIEHSEAPTAAIVLKASADRPKDTGSTGGAIAKKNKK